MITRLELPRPASLSPVVKLSVVAGCAATLFTLVPASELFYLSACGIVLTSWGLISNHELGTGELFSPMFLVGSMLILYYLMGTVLYFSPEKNWPMSEATLAVTLAYVILFSVGYEIGTHLMLGDEFANSLPELYQGYPKRRIFYVALVFVPVGVVLFLYLMHKAGFTSPLAILANIMAFRETWGSEGLTYFMYVSLYTLNAPFWAWIIRGELSLPGKVVAFCYFLLILFIGVLTGLRFATYGAIVGIIYVYHSCVRRLTLRRAIRLGVFLLIPMAFSFAIYGEYRLSTHGGDIGKIARKVSVGDAISRLLLRVAWGINGFAKVVKESDHIPTEWGESFVDLWYLPVPRAWVPNKPAQFDEQMMMAIEPEMDSKFFAEAFSAPGEFYVNFGIPGLIAGGLIFGVLVRVGQKYYMDNRPNRRFILLYQPLTMIPYFYLASGLINSWVHALFIMSLVQGIVFLKLLGRPGPEDAAPVIPAV